MEPMYRGIPFSPQTTLTATIGAADTVIPVADVSAFPDPPSYATIGIDTDGETISYAAKTDNALSGCTRGVEGAPKSWASGSVIARNFTAKDLESLQENLRKIVKGVQSSWIQNDPKEASYVEGRTHYLETFEAVEVISSQAAEFNGTATAYVTGIATGMVEGEPYTVEWNGTEHKCTAKNIGGDIFVGNFSLVGTGGEDTGEPFCIYRFSGTNYMVHKETSSSEVVSLAVGRPYTEVFHKLDGGYLLDGIPYAEHVDQIILPEVSYESDGLGMAYGDYVWELHEGWVYDVNWNGTLYRSPAVLKDNVLKLTQVYVEGTDLLADAPFKQLYPPISGPQEVNGKMVCAALVGAEPSSGTLSIVGYTEVQKLDNMSLNTQPNVFMVEFEGSYSEETQTTTYLPLPDNDTAYKWCYAAEQAGKMIVAKIGDKYYPVTDHTDVNDWYFARVSQDDDSPAVEVLRWKSNYQAVDPPTGTLTATPIPKAGSGGVSKASELDNDVPFVSAAAQELTDEQKTQARTNLGAASASELSEFTEMQSALNLFDLPGSLEFNGDTTGKTYVDVSGDGGMLFVRVSDHVITQEQGFCLIRITQGFEQILGVLVMESIGNGAYAASEYIFSVPTSNFVVDDVTFPEPGIYFLCVPSEHRFVSGLFIPEYTFEESGGVPEDFFTVGGLTDSVTVDAGHIDIILAASVNNVQGLCFVPSGAISGANLSGKTITVECVLETGPVSFSVSGDSVVFDDDGCSELIEDLLLWLPAGYTFVEGVSAPKTGLYALAAIYDGTIMGVTKISIPGLPIFLGDKTISPTYLPGPVRLYVDGSNYLYATSDTSDASKRMTKAELQALADSGQAVQIEVSDAEGSGVFPALGFVFTEYGQCLTHPLAAYTAEYTPETT